MYLCKKYTNATSAHHIISHISSSSRDTWVTYPFSLSACADAGSSSWLSAITVFYCDTCNLLPLDTSSFKDHVSESECLATTNTTWRQSRPRQQWISDMQREICWEHWSGDRPVSCVMGVTVPVLFVLMLLPMSTYQHNITHCDTST